MYHNYSHLKSSLIIYHYIAIGASTPEASTVVTMQDNPSYIAVEGGVILEPNPCYSTIQGNSGHEPISGKGKGL